MKRGALAAALVAIAALVLAELLLLAWRADRIPLIRDQGAAQWIRLGAAVDLGAQAFGERATGFALDLNVLRRPGSLNLRLSTFRGATVHVGERQVATLAPAESALSRTELDLAPHLEVGSNRLTIVVSNDRGPPLLRVESELAGAQSGTHWLASADGKTWVAARRAADVEISRLAVEFPTPAQALGAAWHTLAAGAALALLALWAAPRLFRGRPPEVSLLIYRWLLLAALAALFLHNFHSLPPHVGMDLDAHIEYLDFVRKHGSLPLGHQGWQMFQPPLAYLLLAGANAIAGVLGLAADPAYLGRALTMVASLIGVWFGCRAVELVFRDRPAAAFAGLTLVATLPAGIYMAHAFGNEPYVACLGAIAMHRLALAHRLPPPDPLRHAAILGTVCGLALLAKTSALILVFALAPALWWQLRDAGAEARTAQRALAMFAGLVLAVAGWWYLRNLVEFGRPFVGGWEAGRGIDWWQHPGYRVWEHLFSFGVALSRPIFAGVAGFWDGIYTSLWGDGFLSGAIVRSYAPTWNYPGMMVLYLLAVPLSVAILAGTVRALAASPTSAAPPLGRLSAALLVLYVGAAFHLYATVPIYSSAKGSYLLLLTPAIGILFAWGMEPLLRHRAGRILSTALLGAWIAGVGLAFLASGAQ